MVSESFTQINLDSFHTTSTPGLVVRKNHINRFVLPISPLGDSDVVEVSSVTF